MRVIVVEEKDAGQRLDKFLHRYLPNAPVGFFYKMLRKKNITLNGQKSSGSEKLTAGDEISLFLAEETIEKFRRMSYAGTRNPAEYRKAYETVGELQILYEDSEVLFVNKPVGILSQKAEDKDISLNEWLIGYLMSREEITEETLRLFRPSVCNRLDRNTSGIVICGKTLAGSQSMSALLKDRSLHKYYRLYVEGRMEQEGWLNGWLIKDEKNNRVTVCEKEAAGSSKIVTEYIPVCYNGKWDVTLVEAKLVTGKSHQLRAHFASMGFPLVGDYKYGIKSHNDVWKKRFGISSQLLHCYRIRFPFMEGKGAALSEKEIVAPVPKIFEVFCKNGRDC